MKSKFFYPTKKNVMIGFILSQLLPIIVLGSVGKFVDLTGWLYFELIIIGNLILWRSKPDDEYDEREIGIVNKWKSRMLDYGSSVILIPKALFLICNNVRGIFFPNFNFIKIVHQLILFNSSHCYSLNCTMLRP